MIKLFLLGFSYGSSWFVSWSIRDLRIIYGSSWSVRRKNNNLFYNIIYKDIYFINYNIIKYNYLFINYNIFINIDLL